MTIKEVTDLLNRNQGKLHRKSDGEFKAHRKRMKSRLPAAAARSEDCPPLPSSLA